MFLTRKEIEGKVNDYLRELINGGKVRIACFEIIASGKGYKVFDYGVGSMSVVEFMELEELITDIVLLYC